MRQFEDYILESFDHATGWYQDNGYESLNKTADELLQFRLPAGLNLSFSSLATPNFATSYRLGAGGRFDGSICYLYSSVPLRNVISSSEALPLQSLLRSYRQIQALPRTAPRELPPSPRQGPNPFTAQQALQSFFKQPWLIFGRLFLPHSMLEALVTKRVSPTLRLQVKAVSQADLPNGGTLLGSLQYNKPQYGIESLISTDGGLLGLRGLYNFGGDASAATPAPAVTGPADLPSETNGRAAKLAEERERIYGRFSAGGEIFYGVLNKSAGASLGVRFATLPAHRGTPLTATLTLAPLMGNISASFAVMARDKCSLSTRFDFNFYSYESDWAVGMELWGKGRMAGLIDGANGAADGALNGAQSAGIGAGPSRRRERSFQAKMEWRLDDDSTDEVVDTARPVNTSPLAKTADQPGKGGFSGVLKARMDQNFRVGLLWEGRLKALIFGLGTSISLSQPEQSFRAIGLEIQYSS